MIKHNRPSRTINKKPKKKLETYRHIDTDDLANISGKLTDNSYSIRKILKENVNGSNIKSDRIKRKSKNKSNAKVPGYADDGYAYAYVEKSGTNMMVENLEPSYLSQFDPQTFDNEGIPTATNDIYQSNNRCAVADLEKKISYQGGWTQYDGQRSMTYGIMPDNLLTHNNMMPYFSTKGGYGSNDLLNEGYMDYKNELFTGNLSSTWKKKHEVNTLFAPTEQSFVYGTPVRNDEDDSRVVVSQFMQGAKPTDDTRVTPGLNLDYNEIGTHGYQSLYRPLDKTVDELRVRPRVTNEGRTIAGMKGTAGPIAVPVVQYKADGFKVTNEDDMLPKTDVNHGPKAIQNLIVKEPHRASQSIEYTGGAYTSADAVGRNVPEYMREKHKSSTKPTFKLPKPLQKFSKTEEKFNPNISSYIMPTTTKDLTVNNTHIGSASTTNGSSSYVESADIAKPTLKQITSSMPEKFTVIAPNTMRGTVQPMDIAATTMRETIVDNPLNPHVSMNTTQRVYNTDLARPTVKQTTIDNLAPSNAAQNNNIYANLCDTAKPTMAETIINIPRNNFITASNQAGTVQLMDKAKPTIGETTVGIPQSTFLNASNQYQRAPNHQDTAKVTVQQTTDTIQHNNFISPLNYVGTTHYQDTANTTTKETLLLPNQTNITPINQQQRRPDLQDTPKITTQETTNQLDRNTFINTGTQYQGARNLQDTVRTTMGETTNPLHRNNFINTSTQYQGARNLQDLARVTVQETTNQLDRNTFIDMGNQYQRAPDYQDTMRTTMKQMQTEIPENTFVTVVGQSQGARNLQDTVRTTMGETTNSVNRNTFMVPVGQTQGSRHLQDMARVTMVETTNQLDRNTFIDTGNQYQRAPNLQDTAKVTMAETTNQLDRNTFIDMGNQYQRAPNPQDALKITTRQTTDTIPHQTMLQANGQYQGSRQLQDTQKPTLRETISIPYQTHLSATNQYQGSANTFDRSPLRPTIKQGTVQIPYQTNLDAVGQKQGQLHLQDIARPTLKQDIIQIPYQTTVTAVNQNTGSANTFNRLPLKPTMKETVVEQEYVYAPTNEVGGYGYATKSVSAPNTNKQFTCQEVYVGPLEGTTKSKRYEDAYSATINDKREILQVYRAPTDSGVNLGPDPEYYTAYLRDDNSRAADPILSCTVNNSLDRPDICTTSRPIDTVSSDRFVYPTQLQQLETNPYNIPFYGTPITC